MTSLTWIQLLMARFDGAVMQVEPPAPLGPGPMNRTAAQQALWDQLHAWCHGPAADGRFGAWAWPQAGQEALVEAFLRELDGSDQLARLDRLGGLWLRLRVKWHDVSWRRERQASDPWDAGYLRPGLDVLAALGRFQPRRATLIVVQSAGDTQWQAAHDLLQSRSGAFRHPVRLLRLG